jgi:hypothetical protein
MLAARVTAARATLRTRSVTMRAHVLCASRRVSARADVKTSANSKSHKVHLRAARDDDDAHRARGDADAREK